MIEIKIIVTEAKSNALSSTINVRTVGSSGDTLASGAEAEYAHNLQIKLAEAIKTTAIEMGGGMTEEVVPLRILRKKMDA